jgi:hypothetical protein
MKIRSITGFMDPGWPPDAARLDTVAATVADARTAYAQAGYEVQTTRLATTPFPDWLPELTEEAAVEAAQALEAAALERDFGYVSLGPATLDKSDSYALVPAMLAATQAAFFGAELATREAGISTRALQASANVMQQASTLEENGFANLRFAALANVPAGSPFFPAAYHAGAQPAFAIAPQAADLAVEAFSGAKTVDAGARKLTQLIEEHGRRLAEVGDQIAARHDVRFGGIDFSLAPFPSEAESLGTAFERMGLAAVGRQGSLAAAAVLTSAVDAADFPRAGFNGLLLPPLEDYTLAKRAAEGGLTVNDLLMYSAVCGTGLDTVPLPGDVRVAAMAALLLDLAALALRLDKPLTARLMPIPGKQAGDETTFEFDFFANTRVMALDAEALGGALAAEQMIKLRSR